MHGCRLLLSTTAWLALAVVGSAAPGSLPPLSGQLNGTFVMAGAPPVAWRVELVAPAGTAVHAVVQAEATGLQSRVQIARDPASGAIDWKIESAELNLADWWPVVQSRLPPDLQTLMATGRVQVTGEGRWCDGRISGRAAARLADGRIEDPAKKLVVEGIELAVQIDDLAARRSAPAQMLTWRGGKFDVISLEAGRAVFALDNQTVRVEEASVGAFSGNLALAPFSVSLANPELTVAAHAEQIEVTLLLPLLPPMIVEACGRLNGSLKFHRDRSGIQILDGHLGLNPGETAELRLAPTPGLFSNKLPPFIAKNFYPWLSRIENGEIPIHARRLDVNFTPEADANGHTATVHLEGGPPDHAQDAPLQLDLNVFGPLEPLMKFGTDSRLHFGGVH